MAQEHANAEVGIVERLLELVPEDGTAIGNPALRQAFAQAAAELNSAFDAAAFEHAKQALLDRGLLLKGRGRGGTVRRAPPQDQGFDLSPTAPPTPAQPPKTVRKASPRPPSTGTDAPEVISYRLRIPARTTPRSG
ncbi:hypothetical protein [Thiocystis minor]|uniref:hypothetical protein n=1 Tax=Thiocystis minor TaxID=61597 RepID=UPI001F5C432D|nr:hypothetical protein [Thiocystis minor]